MLIAVNTRLLLPDKLEGIGRFTNETLRRLTRQHPEHQFLFIFDRKWDPQYVYSDNVLPVSVFPQARHPFLYYIWFEYMLPRIFAKYKPAVFLSPDGYLSLRASIPQVQVLHDLAFEHLPGNIDPLHQWHYKTFFPRYCRKAARIAAVSEFTKNDAVATYHIDPVKIDVVGNAASSDFIPFAEEEKKKVREKYTNGCFYFLYIGALHPRKNICNLLLAFDYFKQQEPSNIKLLIAGREAWKNEKMKDIYESMNHKYDVMFTGRLSELELPGVISSALALCYISLFEGFGIPIIEAMQSGVPVITSNTTAMPEVSGGAALLVDPYSPTKMKEGLLSIYKDENLRKKNIEKGLERAKDFTWQQTADKLWNTIIEAT